LGEGVLFVLTPYRGAFKEGFWVHRVPFRVLANNLNAKAQRSCIKSALSREILCINTQKA